jgi:predicted transposase YdaD
VLIEIETYPGRDVDRQVFEDVPLVMLDKGVVPEVLCLVLRQRGQVEVTGTAERVSRHQTARLSASWKVVRLWELRAEDLLAAGDVGLVPWVPLTHSDDPPEVVLHKCRERIDQVTDPSDRAGLLAVTQILAALAYPERKFLKMLGGPQVMIESPLLDEVRELIRAQGREEGRVQGELQGRLQTLRGNVVDALAARFGQVPMDRLASLDQVKDEARLKALHRLAVTCPSLEAFLTGLNEPSQ